MHDEGMMKDTLELWGLGPTYMLCVVRLWVYTNIYNLPQR